MFFEQMHPTWQTWLQGHRALLEAIESQLDREHCQPPIAQVMRAFRDSPLDAKVVIMGQDPYPTPGHAIGLAFAVPKGTSPLPPTLRNLYAELVADVTSGSEGTHGIEFPDLSDWSAQGVLLLNRHLTTDVGTSLAHENLGWVSFTDEAIRQIVTKLQPAPIFVLWGRQAQQVRQLLPESVTVLESPHPSPLSARLGFFGSKPFSRINTLLISRGQAPINWLHA